MLLWYRASLCHIARMLDGGTQCMPLSAAVVKWRSVGRMRGTQSMLWVIGARKPVSRLPRGDCSDQHCGPERAWCGGPLSIVEYYAYSISHGQESACGGRVRPHGLAVSVLTLFPPRGFASAPSMPSEPSGGRHGRPRGPLIAPDGSLGSSKCE